MAQTSNLTYEPSERDFWISVQDFGEEVWNGISPLIPDDERNNFYNKLLAQRQDGWMLVLELLQEYMRVLPEHLPNLPRFHTSVMLDISVEEVADGFVIYCGQEALLICTPRINHVLLPYWKELSLQISPRAKDALWKLCAGAVMSNMNRPDWRPAIPSFVIRAKKQESGGN